MFYQVSLVLSLACRRPLWHAVLYYSWNAEEQPPYGVWTEFLYATVLAALYWFFPSRSKFLLYVRYSKVFCLNSNSFPLLNVVTMVCLMLLPWFVGCVIMVCLMLLPWLVGPRKPLVCLPISHVLRGIMVLRWLVHVFNGRKHRQYSSPRRASDCDPVVRFCRSDTLGFLLLHKQLSCWCKTYEFL